MKNLRNFFKLALGLMMVTSANAQRTIDLQGEKFTLDTIQHYLAGPATKYSRVLVNSQSGSNKFNACILEVDLKANDAPKIEVAMGKDCVRTLETISSMAIRKSNNQKRYIGGTNGDFFVAYSFARDLVNFWGSDDRADDKRSFAIADILGNPNTTCVIDGEVVSPNFLDAASNEKALIICEDGNMYIDGTVLSYKFSTVPKATGDMKYIERTDQALFNFPRSNKDLTIYNKYYGTSTKTADEAGSYEVVLQLKEGEKFCINEPFKMKILAKNYGKGNSTIPENGFVLSGGLKRSTQWTWIDQLNVGDDMEFTINVKLAKEGTMPKGIKTILGGDVKILNAGTVTKKGDPDALRFINEATAKYIRTMIGYNEDRSKLVMCTVDRECGGTGGVSYYDAADLMREYGCYDALDLDGGGSTEMWLKTPGVVAYLRDKVEREIGNAVYAVVYGEEDSTVRNIRFADWALKANAGTTYKPVFYGYNKNSELISMNVADGVKLSAPAELGTVDNNGVLTVKATNGAYTLTATYNGLSTSIPVYVGETAGIDDIFTAKSVNEVEYFDSLGIKVANPEKGNVYIMRQGGTTRKIIF